MMPPEAKGMVTRPGAKKQVDIPKQPPLAAACDRQQQFDLPSPSLSSPRPSPPRDGKRSGNNSPIIPVTPLDISLAIGLKACDTATPDNFRAIDFNTSSNCLPPTVASANAFLIALANVPALTPRALVLLRARSTVSVNSSASGVGFATKLSLNP
jgi:hypothetical protein